MTDPALSITTQNGRYYVHPGRRTEAPSITNITGKKEKPGLKYWAAREAATYAAENLGKLQSLTRDEVVQLVKMAPFRRTESSPSAIGDIVHNWIDAHIKGVPADVTAAEVATAPKTARDMWRQFTGFVERYQPEFRMSEFTVWSDTYGYAGTADWCADLSGTLVLADTKTGKQVYPDTGMQLAALAKADYILDPDGTERPLPSFDRFAVLHLRPTYARLIPVTKIDECFEQFLGLKRVFDFDVAHADTVMGYSPKIETRATRVQQDLTDMRNVAA